MGKYENATDLLRQGRFTEGVSELNIMLREKLVQEPEFRDLQ